MKSVCKRGEKLVLLILMKYPKVSIVTPTLNAEAILDDFIKGIKLQDYPSDKLEVIFADGGSQDKTIEKIQKAGYKVIPNTLKTAEAGKAAGLREAAGEIICLLDSDNILTQDDWIKRMVEPFSDPEIVGTEPIEFTYRKKDGFYTRYFALIGMGDPLVYFVGNYDRFSYLSNKWTGLDIKTKDEGNYLKIYLTKDNLPTIGANGTMMRLERLKPYLEREYLFDIDVISELSETSEVKFAKVKVGVVHIYSRKFSTFIKKQRRRIRDYMFYREKGERTFDWRSGGKGVYKFALACLLVLPLLYQTGRGFIRKPDIAWIFHPIACYVTLWIYAKEYLLAKVFGAKEESRRAWKQA